MKLSNLIGIPFVNKGRDPKLGLDCWGLVIHCYSILKGVQLPDFQICALDSKKVGDEISYQCLYGKWNKVEGPETGCVVVIKNHPKIVNHAGLCIDDKTFIHTLKKTGSVIERIKHPLWSNRIVGYYRYAG
ncbi:MAG: NlpC/P60 family protein [Planctomycetes bacterium]|nr:NlpC/P60 family protein [Planctomycetota bacterium]